MLVSGDYPKRGQPDWGWRWLRRATPLPVYVGSTRHLEGVDIDGNKHSFTQIWDGNDWIMEVNDGN